MGETPEEDAVMLPPIQRLEAVRVEPDDVIVATVAGFTDQQANLLKARLSMVFPANRIAVVSDKVVLAVYQPAEPGPELNPGEPF